MVHQDVRSLEVIINDILDSDLLAVIFSILDPAGRRKAKHPVEKLA
jgi:hypothetical protein